MLKVIYVEIPVKDLERAMKFYQTVFALQPSQIYTDEVRRTNTLVNPAQPGEVGVSLNQTKNFEPSNKGPLVYFEPGDDLIDSLKRVEQSGGKIVEPQTPMGGAGHYAIITDSEGNALALYSSK